MDLVVVDNLDCYIADIKIRCVNCSRVIMLSRIDFNKEIRKVIGNYEEEK